MLRRSLVALVAAVLLLTAACSDDGDDGIGSDGAGGDSTELDQSADGAATADTGVADTGTADTGPEGGGGKSSDFCDQVAARPLTNDPEDAAEHYAKLRGVAPEHLQDDAALLEKEYRELADNGDDASDIDDGGAIESAIADLVQFQKDICFG